MKKELRKIFINKRNCIIEKEEKDRKIISLLNNIIKDYNKIMIYYPIGSEINILPIIEDNKDKKFYLPYCNKQEIEVRYIDDFNTLIKDDVGILSSKIKTDEEIDVVIAPAVACNTKFYRLGYGGGYYDRFLKNKKVKKITITYDEALIENDFQELFDIAFDYIVTEEKILSR